MYVGGRDSFEELIVQRSGINFKSISAGKLRRYFDFRNLIDFFKIPAGILQTFFIISKFKPDIVFATCGYTSVPVAFAAYFRKIPLILHESDVSPGLAAKICSRFAAKILLGWEASRKFFHGYENKIEVVFNPVREEIFNGSKGKGYSLTGFSDKKPVLLVMGGSLGALSLNELIYKNLPQITKICQIIHITGKGKAETPAIKPLNYKNYEYVEEELPHFYAIADLIVSRAGSLAISEILSVNKPAILLPLGRHASRGDQFENANEAKKYNENILILDEANLAPEDFPDSIKKMLQKEPATENKKMLELKSSAKHIADILFTFYGADRKT